MTHSMQCPACEKAVLVEPENAGQKVRCPHCSQPFVVPGQIVAVNDDDDWLSLDDAPPPSKPKPTAGTKPKVRTKPRAGSTSNVGSKPKQKTSSKPGSKSKPSGNTKPKSPTPSIPDISLPSTVPPESSGDDFFGDALPPIDLPSDPVLMPSSSPLASPPTAQSVELATNYYIRCKVCESVSDVTADQAGTSIQCHDCHTSMKVPPPPRAKKKPKPVDLDRVESFSFTDPVQSERPADPFVTSARQLLESAEKEEVEEPPDDYDTPDTIGWLKDVFGIFTYPGVLFYTIFLSLAGGVGAGIFVTFMIIPSVAIACIVGAVFWIGMVVACGFVIMESIANGAKEIDGWPEPLNPGEWLGPITICTVAFGLVSSPGWFVGLSLFGPSWGLVFLVMLLVYLLFPFVLLSILDMDSVFTPFSPEVARSVTKSKDAWGGFYFSAGLLFGLAFLIAMTLNSLFKDPGFVVIAILFVMTTFVYFAMLGRLAYSIGQGVNAGSGKEDSDSPRSKTKNSGGKETIQKQPTA